MTEKNKEQEREKIVNRNFDEITQIAGAYVNHNWVSASPAEYLKEIQKRIANIQREL